MSFQAYLDAAESKTGKTPRELLREAAERGFDGPATKAGDVIAWLAADYGLGRGHAMAIVHLIKNGPEAPRKAGEPRVAAWLDGKATRPAAEG